MPLDEDTVSLDAMTHEQAQARMKQVVVTQSIEELLGPQAREAATRIKEGSHTIEDVFMYQSRLREIFSEEHSSGSVRLRELKGPKSKTGPIPKYSALASDAASIIVSDFEYSLEEGLKREKESGKLRTYGLAVQNVNNIGNKTANFEPRNLVSLLRDMLYRKDGTKYNAPFPGLLTTLWTLKQLRPSVYENSLNAAKWAVLIGEAVNAFNESKGIELRVDTKDLFLYALVQNAGLLDPSMPLVDSGKAFGGKEKFQLVGHGDQSIDILRTNYFPIPERPESGPEPPESRRFRNVLTYHTHPKVYGVAGYDRLTATLVGITAAAEMFEAMWHKRTRRKVPLTPDEVSNKIEDKMFTGEELIKVKEILRQGYAYNDEQVKSYPLMQPYLMLCLAFGKLERI